MSKVLATFCDLLEAQRDYVDRLDDGLRPGCSGDRDAASTVIDALRGCLPDSQTLHEFAIAYAQPRRGTLNRFFGVFWTAVAEDWAWLDEISGADVVRAMRHAQEAMIVTYTAEGEAFVPIMKRTVLESITIAAAVPPDDNVLNVLNVMNEHVWRSAKRGREPGIYIFGYLLDAFDVASV